MIRGSGADGRKGDAFDKTGSNLIIIIKEMKGWRWRCEGEGVGQGREKKERAKGTDERSVACRVDPIPFSPPPQHRRPDASSFSISPISLARPGVSRLWNDAMVNKHEPRRACGCPTVEASVWCELGPEGGRGMAREFGV